MPSTMKSLFLFLRRWQYMIGSLIILIGLVINGCLRSYPRYSNIKGGRILDRHTGHLIEPSD